MNYLLIYWIFSVIYESINIYFLRKSFLKKANEIDGIKLVKQYFMESANFQNVKQKIWNPFTIIFGFTPLFIIISPFLLPLSLFSLIKKLTGYKTKLEKRAEAETKAMEEAQKRNEEWLRTEGERLPENFKINIEN